MSKKCLNGWKDYMSWNRVENMLWFYKREWVKLKIGL